MTAAVVGTAKKAKTITVRDTVMINNVSFQIVKIEKNAFKGNKKVTAVKIGKNVQNDRCECISWMYKFEESDNKQQEFKKD